MFGFFKGKKKQEARLVVRDARDLGGSEKQIAALNGFQVRQILRSLEGQRGAASLDAKKIRDKFFPRTIEDVRSSTGETAPRGAYAMDGALDLRGMMKMPRISDKVGRFLAGVDAWLGWQVCALLGQNWLINRVCLAHGEDAAAVGYRLVSYDDESLDVQFLQEMENRSISEFGILDACSRAVFLKRMFGGSITYPVIDGANYEEEFDISKVKRGSYRGMRSIEPWWITYEFADEAVNCPGDLHFYDPTYYVVGGSLKIHRSWVVKLINAPVGDILKPAYYYYGIPTPQMIYDRVYCFERIANEAPILAMTKRLTILDADIEMMVNDPNYAQDMLNAMVQLRDNFGVLVKSPDNAVSQLDTTLTDFDTLIQKQGEIAAAIGEIPLDKVVKTSSKNSNSGGLFQENEYKAVLRRVQNRDFRPILDFHNKLYLKSEKGCEERIGVEFNPLDTPSELDIAKTNEVNAMYLAHLQSLGNISQEEVRRVLRSLPYSKLNWISKEPPMPELNFGEESEEGGADAEKDAHKQIEGNAERYKSTGISNAVKNQ